MEGQLVEVRDAFVDVLGTRLVALALYGSAVTGDAIPGFSDLDLYVVVTDAVTLGDSIRLHRQMPEPDGVAYIQPSFQVVSSLKPHLVPGAFLVLSGTLPDRAILDQEDLTRSSEQALDELPSIVQGDVLAWPGAVGEKRPRHVRLLTTRLKPAVRGLLVKLGDPPVETWRASWDQLAEAWAILEPERAQSLGGVLGMLRARPRDDRACGEALLHLLASICEDAAVAPVLEPSTREARTAKVGQRPAEPDEPPSIR